MIYQTPTKLLTDLELLRLVCSGQDNQDAYNEFVQRFYNELKAECARRCSARKLDKQIGVQIAHETFEKLKRHKTFREDEIKRADPRTGILVYLIRISVNLFNDHHRSEKKQVERANHTSYLENLVGEVDYNGDLGRLKQIKDLTLQIFKRLNKREQQVVLADVEHKKHQKYLPDDVTESLSIELGIKKESIRKIRQRAIQKIKTAIDEFNQA